VTRTLASLLAAGALVCGCGSAAPARRAAATPTPSPTPVSRGAALATLHATHARGRVTYCSEVPSAADTAAIRRFDAAQHAIHARVMRLVNTPQGRARARRCDVLAFVNVQTADLAAGLADLTPYVRARRGEFFPAAVAGVTYRGRLWAVPRYADVTVVFAYPGTTPPATWDVFYGVRNNNRVVAAAGDGSVDTAERFAELLYAAGGRLVAPDGRSAVDGPAGRRALALLVRAFNGGAVMNIPTDHPRDLMDELGSGGAALLPGNTIEAGWVRRTSAIKVHTAEVPHFAGGPPRPLVYSVALGVLRRSRHKAAALALIDALTRPAAARAAARAGQVPPLVASLRDARVTTRLSASAVIRTSLEHGVAFPPLPDAERLILLLGRQVHRALTRQATVPQALAAMARAIDDASGAGANGDAA
jgi:ABC-type glycerol-3-phosphate transport system substrate-binding protein